MTATETATAPKNKNNHGGHRFKVGHKHYPRWRKGAASQAPIFKRRAAKILAAIVAEREGDLSATQMIHAQSVADLGAAILELKDRRKAGEYIDPVAISNLVNAQRRSLDALGGV